MEKWYSIVCLLLIGVACNSHPSTTAISAKKQQKADSLFQLASTQITQNQNELKDDPLALKYLDEAIQLNPHKIDFYLNRGAAKINLLMYQEAISDFEVVLAKDSTNVNALLNTGLCYNHLKNYNQGIAYATKAIKQNDQLGYAYYVRSDGYLYLNDIDKLCKDLEAAMKRNYQPAIQRMSMYCNKNIKHLKF